MLCSLLLITSGKKRNNILTTPGDVPDYVGITNVAPRNSGKVEE